MDIKQANVVFLGTSLIRGGDKVDFYRLAPNLLKDANKRYLISLAKVKDGLEINGQNVISLGWSSSASYPLAIYRLAKFIREKNIHLVHSFSRCSNIVGYAAAKLSARPVKTVMEVISQLQRPSEMEPSLGWGIWNVLERKVYPKSDLLLCNSASASQEAVNIYGCDPLKVKTVKNWVPINEIGEKVKNSKIRGLEKYEPYWLGAGRFVKAKGFEYLLKAYALTREKTKFNLVLAGDGPLLLDMKGLANQLGVAEQVLFLGWVDDVIPYHRGAIAFVAPSNYEGLPYAVLEAMAAGTPVITTRCTSWIDEFESRGACITAPIGDINALARTMLKVANDEGLRGGLIDSAHKVIYDFAEEKVMAERESLLRKILR